MNEEEKDAIEKLTNGEKITLIELIRKMKREGIERFIVTRPEYVYIILNLIEKLQKENEELKENDNKYTIHLTDEQYNKVIEIVQNGINQKWIRKVKDKIKILEKLQNEFLNNEELRVKIIAYKELIEEREEK